jgi:hypothetical protein
MLQEIRVVAPSLEPLLVGLLARQRRASGPVRSPEDAIGAADALVLQLLAVSQMKNLLIRIISFLLAAATLIGIGLILGNPTIASVGIILLIANAAWTAYFLRKERNE